MPQHNEKRFLPYKPEQLFDLVVSIERYPEFLPWCKEARVLSREDHQMTADLIIGYKMFTERFRSLVLFERPHKISVQYISGPLSRLGNEWTFVPAPGGCELSFQVDFDFRSPLLRLAMQAFFDKALVKMVAAFEKRAAELYGSKKKRLSSPTS